MAKENYWKFAFILFVIFFSTWAIYPLEEKINLGLDLQGGLHLVLEVETEKAVDNTIERYMNHISDTLKKEGKKITSITREGGNIVIDPGTVFEEEIGIITRELPGLEINDSLSSKGKRVYELGSKYRKDIEEKAVDQGLETMRNRIDQFGVAEPSIQREGKKRIIIQLPGIRDTERAIGLIGKTAQLEFKILDDSGNLSEALNGNIPDGDEILYQKQNKSEIAGVDLKKQAFLVIKKVMMTGEYIQNAEVKIDSRYNDPYISMDFDTIGATLFGNITKNNVNKRMAVILDGNIYTAPVIKEEIRGGKAQITGSFTTEEARDLAIILRAGALPAPVTILENRTVGPSLGKDSITKGVNSALIGGALVVFFMVFYYKKSGVIAVVALSLNILILLASMALFKATLTLPGIAGIVLTIGMAVDTNILIYERIREELEVGKSARAAIDSGFSRAFMTILDSHVTTVIAALILFQFGTGPIKGFALTLSTGLAASMFTAFFVSRFIFSIVTYKRKMEALSI